MSRPGVPLRTNNSMVMWEHCTAFSGRLIVGGVIRQRELWLGLI